MKHYLINVFHEVFFSRSQIVVEFSLQNLTAILNKKITLSSQRSINIDNEIDLDINCVLLFLAHSEIK